MTREEAKHMRLFTQWQEEAKFITWETTTDEIIGDHNLIIDEIFDAFESRNCSSCKSWNKEFGTCHGGTLTEFGYGNSPVTSETFSCNEWEAKDA